MGKFTGKCDFMDTCEMFNTPEEILKANIYIDNSKIDFQNNPKNLIPYYIFIAASEASSKNDDGTRNLSIWLSNEDYFISYEKDIKVNRLNDIVLVLKKMKKSKLDLNDEQSFFTSYMALFNRSREDTENSLIMTIYNYLKPSYRKDLANFKYPYKENTRINRKLIETLVDEMIYSVRVPYIQNRRKEFLDYCKEQNVPEDNMMYRHQRVIAGDL